MRVAYRRRLVTHFHAFLRHFLSSSSSSFFFLRELHVGPTLRALNADRMSRVSAKQRECTHKRHSKLRHTLKASVKSQAQSTRAERHVHLTAPPSLSGSSSPFSFVICKEKVVCSLGYGRRNKYTGTAPEARDQESGGIRSEILVSAVSRCILPTMLFIHRKNGRFPLCWPLWSNLSTRKVVP